MNDDGTVMRGPELAAFAERQKLQRISIAELIAYRQARDKLIERAGEFPVETEIGTLTGYAFLTPFDQVYHMAFVYGRIGDGKNVLTRLHHANIISDVFGGAKPIHQALGRFKAEGRGVLILCSATALQGCRSFRSQNSAKPHPTRRARGNGGRSVSARKLTRISASIP